MWLYVGWKEVLTEKATSGSRTESDFCPSISRRKELHSKRMAVRKAREGGVGCIQGAQGGWRKSLGDQIQEMARSRPQRTWGEQAKAQVLTLAGDKPS